MKKFAIVACVWFVLLGVKVTSSSEAIPYEIYFDSTRSDLYEVKDQILVTYNELMLGVNEESDAMMILHNLDQFMLDDTMEVSWNKNTLVIQVGDRNGAHITGTLERSMMCMPEVKPKSLLQELFAN